MTSDSGIKADIFDLPMGSSRILHEIRRKEWETFYRETYMDFDGFIQSLKNEKQTAIVYDSLSPIFREDCYDEYSLREKSRRGKTPEFVLSSKYIQKNDIRLKLAMQKPQDSADRNLSVFLLSMKNDSIIDSQKIYCHEEEKKEEETVYRYCRRFHIDRNIISTRDCYFRDEGNNGLSMLNQYRVNSQGEIEDIWHPDTIMITRKWKDKNGSNLLTVQVNALSNQNRRPFDGYITFIESSLKNDGHNLYIRYNEDDYRMSMIFFDEKNIRFHKYEGIQAVFIPFRYCCDLYSENTVSYIILYDNNTYLYHFTYTCNLEAYHTYGEGICELFEPNLNKKLKKMPDALRLILIKYLRTQHKTTKYVLPPSLRENEEESE
jgi:hypothetical protein